MSTSYELAPATAILATHCACCGRPLLDAKSVETGVGPECRKRHGFAEAQGEACWPDVWTNLRALWSDDEATPSSIREAANARDAHATANAIVYRVALDQTGTVVAHLTAALRGLGYERLATRIAERLGAVRVDEEGGELVVRAPFRSDFNEAVRRVPGQRWDAKRKVRVVPAGSRKELWRALCWAFPNGTLVVGKYGMTLTRAPVLAPSRAA